MNTRIVWVVEFKGEDWLFSDIEEFNSYEEAKAWADPAKFIPGVRALAIYALVKIEREFYREIL